MGEQLADQLRLAAEGHAGKLLEALDHAVDGRHQPLFLRGVVAVVAVIFQHGKRQRQKIALVCLRRLVKQPVAGLMQPGGGLLLRLLPQPVALNGVETRMLPQAILPGAVEQIMLQELAVARIEAAVEQRFASIDRLCQRRRRGGIGRQCVPQARGEIAFNELRAAAQGPPQPMDQAQALVERAAPQLVTAIGTDGDLQVVETLDFTGHLGYILPGYRGDAVDSA